MDENLKGLTVSNTFGRLVQIVNGKYYDGLGNLLNLDSLSNNFSIDGGTPDSTISTNVFKIDFGGVE